MKYDLRKLMKKAWSLYRKASKKAETTFSAALKAAWAWIKVQAANAAKVEAAAEAAGYADDVIHTWAGWQSLRRMVMHTSEAVFKVEVADPTTRKGTRIQFIPAPRAAISPATTRKGTRIQSYFTYEQTQPTPAIE